MRHPSPLPQALRAGPFTVREADTRGVDVQRLRRRDVVAVTRGVRVGEEPTTLLARAAAVSLALSGHVVFSHVTAAQVHGLWLPDRLVAREHLDVMGLTEVTRVRRRGCTGHRGIESRAVEFVDDLPVTSLVDTWCDLGQLAGRGLALEDFVVLGDQVATRLARPEEPGRRLIDGVEPLRSALMSRGRIRGKRTLRQALPLVRPGPKSRMETLSRLVFVGAGLPEPEVNGDIWDEAGEWLMEGDLVWREQRVVGEYQSDHHAGRRERSKDAARRELAGDHGWRVFEIFAEDVFNPARRHALVARVRSAVT